jgi:hypothetical protein
MIDGLTRAVVKQDALCSSATHSIAAANNLRPSRLMTSLMAHRDRNPTVATEPIRQSAKIRPLKPPPQSRKSMSDR